MRCGTRRGKFIGTVFYDHVVRIWRTGSENTAVRTLYYYQTAPFWARNIKTACSSHQSLDVPYIDTPRAVGSIGGSFSWSKKGVFCLHKTLGLNSWASEALYRSFQKFVRVSGGPTLSKTVSFRKHVVGILRRYNGRRGKKI